MRTGSCYAKGPLRTMNDRLRKKERANAVHADYRRLCSFVVLVSAAACMPWVGLRVSHGRQALGGWMSPVFILTVAPYAVCLVWAIGSLLDPACPDHPWLREGPKTQSPLKGWPFRRGHSGGNRRAHQHAMQLRDASLAVFLAGMLSVLLATFAGISPIMAQPSPSTATVVLFGSGTAYPGAYASAPLSDTHTQSLTNRGRSRKPAGRGLWIGTSGVAALDTPTKMRGFRTCSKRCGLRVPGADQATDCQDLEYRR